MAGSEAGCLNRNFVVSTLFRYNIHVKTHTQNPYFPSFMAVLRRMWKSMEEAFNSPSRRSESCLYSVETDV